MKGIIGTAVAVALLAALWSMPGPPHTVGDEPICVKFTAQPAQADSQAEGTKLFDEIAESLGFTHAQYENVSTPPNCLFDEVSLFNIKNAIFEENLKSTPTVDVGALCFPERNPAGMAVGDVDMDGDDDLFFATMTGPNRLYCNQGDGKHFIECSEKAGLDSLLRSAAGRFADFDNDGDLDLFVTTVAETQFLFYLNDGQGNFHEAAVEHNAAVFPGTKHRAGNSIGVGDYDHDGWLDMHITEWLPFYTRPTEPVENYASNVRLLRNLGAQGKPAFFEDVTVKAGVATEAHSIQSINSGHGENEIQFLKNSGKFHYADGTYSFSSAFVDLDNDGWEDLAITSDFGTAMLYWNQGDGTFDLASKDFSGIYQEENAMGQAFGDIDNDGLLDWVVTSIKETVAQGDVKKNPRRRVQRMFGEFGNKVYKNLGERKFEEVADKTQLTDSGWGWGVDLFDFDNDGDLDIASTGGYIIYETTFDDYWNYSPMNLFQNNNPGSKALKVPWKEMAAQSGLSKGFRQARGLGALDLDNDGDLDVLACNQEDPPQVFRNNLANGNHWLAIDVLEPHGVQHSLNARVYVTTPSVAEGNTRMHAVGASGAHFMMHTGTTAHFGFGDSSTPIANVTVVWPARGSRPRQRLELHSVTPDARLVIRRPPNDQPVPDRVVNVAAESSAALPVCKLVKPPLKHEAAWRLRHLIQATSTWLSHGTEWVLQVANDIFTHQQQQQEQEQQEQQEQQPQQPQPQQPQQPAHALAVSQDQRSLLSRIAPSATCWGQTSNLTGPQGRYQPGGKGNNLLHPGVGQTPHALRRLVAPAYDDQFEVPARSAGPSARVVSNAVGEQAAPIPDENGLSDLSMHLGQLISHDISHTPPVPHFSAEANFFIRVPKCDTLLDPNCAGNQAIRFKRSTFDCAEENAGTPREQSNTVTPWLDGSFVYGSDPQRTTLLRAGRGGQLMLPKGHLPDNSLMLDNDNPLGRKTYKLKVTGDRRTNIQPGLLVLHTVFAREHNYLASALAEAMPSLNDEELFQRARSLLVAELQAIVFEEYLPSILGPEGLSPYRGYDPEIDPRPSQLFSTVAFRFGHSQTNDRVLQPIVRRGKIKDVKTFPLQKAYFDPSLVTMPNAFGPLVLGLVLQPAQKVDTRVVSSMRTFLFGKQSQYGSGGLDLLALNIQRGRDHGVASYNVYRKALGLEPVTDFSQLGSDAAVHEALAEVYNSVDDIDPFVGGLAEDHVEGSSVGPLFHAAIKEQFERLRSGDRLFYENLFPADAVTELRKTRISQLLKRHVDSTLASLIPDDALHADAPAQGFEQGTADPSPGL